MTSSVSSSSTATPSYCSRVLTDDSDSSLWNSFVSDLPEADVLQAWEWAAVKSPEWRPLRVVVYKGDSIVAGAQILRRKVPLVGIIYYAPRGPLSVDWSDVEAFRTLLHSIRREASKEGAAMLKIDPAISSEDHGIAEMLITEGFVRPQSEDDQGFGGTQPRCVMQLDLAGRSLDEVRASFKGQTRRNIKLACEKHGVTVRHDLDRSDLVTFDHLMKITGERDGFRPRSLRYFQNVWDALFAVGMCRLFLSYYEGSILSGALCFKLKDKCWYVYGASSNEHRNVMPNYAMQWAMVSWAYEAGCSWYDFRGVSQRRRQEGENVAEIEEQDHLQGLNRFKEGFSPRYVEYIGEYDLVYKPLQYWAYCNGIPLAKKLLKKLKP